MLQKVYFSELPEPIKYVKTSTGFADVWLRTNIKEAEVFTDREESYIQYTADENYFRVKTSKMPIEYVKLNFDRLLNYDETDIRYGGTPSVEDRISDLESTIADLVDMLNELLMPEDDDIFEDYSESNNKEDLEDTENTNIAEDINGDDSNEESII